MEVGANGGDDKDDGGDDDDDDDDDEEEEEEGGGGNDAAAADDAADDDRRLRWRSLSQALHLLSIPKTLFLFLANSLRNLSSRQPWHLWIGRIIDTYNHMRSRVIWTR
jgi:hypothetical protein